MLLNFVFLFYVLKKYMSMSYQLYFYFNEVIYKKVFSVFIANLDMQLKK